MSGALPFNKMFIMLPVMLAARKLDGEDPFTVNMVRVAYGVVQLLCIFVVVLTYVKAYKVSKISTTVYVPSAAQPFATADAKKKYTEISYGQHIANTARTLVGSTLFGIALTCALHYYRGMVMGLAIQVVMGPLGLYENVLARTIVLRGVKALTPGNAIFDEKTIEDLTMDDEVVDAEGNPVVRSQVGAAKSKSIKNNTEKPVNGSTAVSLEELLLDTWDQGVKANLAPLLAALNEKNVNYQTEDQRWTALMIISGLNCPGVAAVIQLLRSDYKADLTIKDNDGWTALHWAAFHNSEVAAKELSNETALLTVKDKEGKTPEETAKAECNDTVAAILKPVSKKSQ